MEKDQSQGRKYREEVKRFAQLDRDARSELVERLKTGVGDRDRRRR